MNLLTYPRNTTLLRRKARPIREDEFGSDALLSFAQRLANMMMQMNGAGIASTQVDEEPDDGPYSLFAMRVDEKHFGVFCNPSIVTVLDDCESGPEGCLSFASVQERMFAPKMLQLRFRNTMGHDGDCVFADHQARVVAHELHHLDGRLIVDRMSQLKRVGFLREVLKRQKAKPAYARAQA